MAGYLLCKTMMQYILPFFPSLGPGLRHGEAKDIVCMRLVAAARHLLAGNDRKEWLQPYSIVYTILQPLLSSLCMPLECSVYSLHNTGIIQKSYWQVEYSRYTDSLYHVFIQGYYRNCRNNPAVLQLSRTIKRSTDHNQVLVQRNTEAVFSANAWFSSNYQACRMGLEFTV
jgi:hypothetical protein